MDAETFLAELTAHPDYEGQLVWHEREPGRRPRYAETSLPLPDPVRSALSAAGVEGLYAHQAEAIDLLRAARSTIVATGTASGKTICYHVPIMEAALSGGTALYLAPTRALGADQLRQVRRYPAPWLVADTYDSDTPTHVRASIRANARLVLTNPDMLHVGILPNHHRWSGFLRRLRYVVVDEAHVCRGVFGSHVSLVLRRLRRLAKRYGSEPVFALASATIHNPADHARSLVGVDVEAVTQDAAPSGGRSFVFWNPPSTEADERRSTNGESAAILEALVRAGARSLVFSRSRLGAELVARYCRDRLDDDDRGRVAAYRAGYLHSERRTVEQGLNDGSLGGVSATNALELGIDIGDLDAVVLNGFPGTIASARQQAGRAGRAGRTSLAVLVPADEPLDQFYASHPKEFFGRPHEAALTNPSNPYVLRPHLGCAAYEHPLGEADVEFFGDSLAAEVADLVADGTLRERRDRAWWASTRSPAGDVNLRSAGGSPYRIVEADTGRVVGSSDAGRALQELYPGAIYLHQDETYRVVDLVLDDRVALVETTGRFEYTQPRVDHDLMVLDRDRSGRIGPAGLWAGTVQVTDRVTGFRRRRLPDGQVLEQRDLDLPPEKLVTRAVWYTIPESTLYDRLEPLGGGLELVMAALHAAEHASIGILPVFAMCDRWDIGGLSTPLHPDTGEPTWFVYDGYPMGAGISDHAFEVASAHLEATREHVEACPCASGCPACVQSPKCGNFNEYLDKKGAIQVLRLLTLS